MGKEGNFISNAGESLSKKAVNLFAESYEKNLDDMFGRLHEHKAAGEAYEEYKKEKYRRFGVKTKEEAYHFKQKMEEYGVDVIVTPTAFRGQYLIEIPAFMKVADLQDEGLKELAAPQEEQSVLQQGQQGQQQGEQGQQQGEQGQQQGEQEQQENPAPKRQEQEYLTAEQVVAYYESETLETVEEVNRIEWESPGDIMCGVPVHTYLTQHMDYFGRAVNQVIRMTNEVEREKSDTGIDVFRKDYGKRTPTPQTGSAGRAIVLRGEIVIIDGKIVEGKVKNDVLRQHRERMQIISDIGDRKTKMAAEHAHHEEERRDRFEEREKQRKDRFEERETSRETAFNAKQEKLQKKTDEKNAKREKKGKPTKDWERKTFIRKQFTPATFTPHEARVSETIRREEQNAEKIQQSLYRQEYAVSDAKYIKPKSKWSGGELDAYISQLNTAAIAGEMTKDIVLSPKAQTAFADMRSKLPYLTADQKTLLERVSTTAPGQTVTLTIDERKSLVTMTARYKEYSSPAVKSVLQMKNSIRLGREEAGKLLFASESNIRIVESELGVAVVPKKYFTQQNLEAINDALIQKAKAAGIDITDSRGKLHIGKLKALSEQDLKKMGISTPLLRDIVVAQNFRKKLKLTEENRKGIEEILKTAALLPLERQLSPEKQELLERLVNLKDGEEILLSANERQMLTEVMEQYTEEQDSSAVEAFESVKIDAEEEVMAGEISIKGKENVGADTLLHEIEHDFGIEITVSNPLTRERMLEINEQFLKKAETAGFQFVDSKGNFDVDMLKNLNGEQLAAIGISENTRDMLVSINSKTAWGNTATTGDTLRKGTSVLTRTVMKLNDDAEFQQTMQDFQKMGDAARYAKKTYSTVRRLGNIRMSDIRMAQQTGFQAIAEAYKREPPKMPERVKPKVEQARPVDRAANEAYSAKLKEKAAKLARKENGFIYKTSQKYEAVKKKVIDEFGKTVAGKALVAIKGAVSGLLAKLIPLALLACVIFATFIVSIVVIVASISSFFETKVEDTVAYKLSEVMTDDEEKWLDSLEDYGNAYSKRKNLRYGVDYQEYSAYIGTFNGLEIDDDNLYINPFTEIDGLNKESTGNGDDVREKVKEYDGSLSVGISANASVYGKKDTDEFNSGYTSIESGHTSNIKDILSMVDVMYQLDIDSNSDSGMADESVLGKTPFQMAADNVKGFVTDWLHGDAGEWLYDKFHGESTDDTFTTAPGVTYDTIKSYADVLFQNSHQSELALQLDFYNLETPKINGEDANMKQEEASRLGYCVEPITRTFKLFYDTDKGNIAPYLEDSDGHKHSLDTTENLVRVSMSNAKKNSDGTTWWKGGNDNTETSCLWNGMEENEATRLSIESNIENHQGCWTVAEPEYYLDDSEIIEREVAKFDYGTYEDEAWNWGEPSEWGEMANGFEDLKPYGHDYSKDNNGDNYMFDIERSIIEKAGKEGKETKYELSEDRNTLTVYKYLPNWELVKTGYNMSWNDFHNVENNGQCFLFPSETKVYGDYDDEKIISMTYYKYTVKKTVYTRDCKGHEFEYCGGHISVHSQGVVFSATNEQIAMAGIADTVPLAEGLELSEENGLDSLLGKYDKDKFNYGDSEDDEKQALESVVSQSCGTKSPLEDPAQGTFFHNQGLNLYVEDGQWKSGMQINDENCYHLMRDIFDIDCLVRKGDDVFPIRSFRDYEGWTADNMELAIMKMSSDWYDSYEFDVPWEIGCQTLSSQDISTIIAALKEKYKEDFTEERQKLVELTLSWVGRGHYNEYHNKNFTSPSCHDFLSSPCTGITDAHFKDDATGEEYDITFQGSCTASDSFGFVNYIYNQCGKSDVTHYPFDVKDINAGNVSSDGIRPGDVITHEGYDNDRYNLHGKEISKENLDAIFNFSSDRAAIYIGELDEEIVLSSGQRLHAGVPIIVDLNQIGGVGNIWIHGTAHDPDNYFEFDGKVTYGWVTDSDAHSLYRSFDSFS